jgi:hypothetical protein
MYFFSATNHLHASKAGMFDSRIRFDIKETRPAGSNLDADSHIALVARTGQRVDLHLDDLRDRQLVQVAAAPLRRSPALGPVRLRVRSLCASPRVFAVVAAAVSSITPARP